MIHIAEQILISRPDHLLGRSLHRQLLYLGHPASHIVSAPLPNFHNLAETRVFLETHRPEQLYLIAQDFQNNSVQPSSPDWHPDTSADATLIRAAYLCGVRRLIYVADSRVYPAPTPQPVAEWFLCAAPASPQLDSHAARVQRHCLRLCDSLSQGEDSGPRVDFRGAVVSELYGPLCQRDIPHPLGHPVSEPHHMGLVETLLHQLIRAESQGLNRLRLQLPPYTPMAVDLLYADDAAEALVYLLELPRKALANAAAPAAPCHINIGSGVATHVDRLARQAAMAVGYFGLLDPLAPTSSELAVTTRSLCTRRLHDLSWEPLIDLECGLELTAMDQRLRTRRHDRASALARPHPA